MMDATKLLQADILDIVFDGRNKAYGAYELRRAYNKRLGIAMAVMAAICLSAFVGAVMSRNTDNDLTSVMKVTDYVLEDYKDEVKPPTPPPPVTPPPPPAAVQTAMFTPPDIVDDNEVPEDVMPPSMDELVDSKIGTMKIDGGKDDGIVTPPSEKGTGEVVQPLQAQMNNDTVFVKVEMPAEFPGGIDAWRRYLERNLQYPDAAISDETQGVVRVQFVIDTEGNVSDVVALNDPGNGLAEEAIRIIARGPKWIPAEQNNRKVKYRHSQPIIFRLD